MKTCLPFVILVIFLSTFGKGIGQRSVANESLAPFYHGVASGDPTANSVIIWTRVTPESTDDIDVNYMIATDPQMDQIVQMGETTADSDRDYTVKLDIQDLDPETTYYFQFVVDGVTSMVGRTRTTPLNASEHLKFAVVSCNNYEHGYFNAFERISRRADLDAVLHLGDYIYEYEPGNYGSDQVDRVNDPDHEIVELADYRTRYSQYRLDSDLRRAHQQHPFICIWDDHESANDAYVDGAENHDPNNEYTEGKVEGEWDTRKSAALQAYLEWMPIRETELNIRRNIRYGDLADLFMMDTRLEGRDEQPPNVIEANTTFRTMLGEDQRDWLLEGVDNSTSTWKIMVNQVIFSHLNLGFAAGFLDGTPDNTNIDSINQIESIFMDIWDGYPQERSLIIDQLELDQVDNFVVVSGDFHSAFAFDITDQPAIYPNPLAFNLPTPSPVYDPVTGEGSIGVEFVTPSITSANFDENIGAAAAAQFEVSMNNDLPTGNPMLPTVNYNPHMKYTDLDRHGYFILDITTDSVQANYYFVNSILDDSDTTEAFDRAFYTLNRENHLNPASGASAPKAIIPDLAPDELTVSISETPSSGVTIIGLHPNPVTADGNLQFSVASPADLSIQITNQLGQPMKQVASAQRFSAGLHRLNFTTDGWTPGVYILWIQKEGGLYESFTFVVAD